MQNTRHSYRKHKSESSQLVQEMLRKERESAGNETESKGDHSEPKNSSFSGFSGRKRGSSHPDSAHSSPKKRESSTAHRNAAVSNKTVGQESKQKHTSTASKHKEPIPREQTTTSKLPGGRVRASKSSGADSDNRKASAEPSHRTANKSTNNKKASAESNNRTVSADSDKKDSEQQAAVPQAPGQNRINTALLQERLKQQKALLTQHKTEKHLADMFLNVPGEGQASGTSFSDFSSGFSGIDINKVNNMFKN